MANKMASISTYIGTILISIQLNYNKRPEFSDTYSNKKKEIMKLVKGNDF